MKIRSLRLIVLARGCVATSAPAQIYQEQLKESPEPLDIRDLPGLAVR